MKKSCKACGSRFVTRYQQRKFCRGKECLRLRACAATKKRAKKPKVRAQRNRYSAWYRTTRKAKRAEKRRRELQRAALTDGYLRFLLAKQFRGTAPKDFSSEAVEAKRRLILKRRKKQYDEKNKIP